MPRHEPRYLVGLMSGTSCDGLDVAIVEAGSARLHAFRCCALEPGLQEAVLRLAEPGMDDIDILGHLDQAIGEASAQAVLKTLDEGGVLPEQVLCIGSHGQTVRHRPRRHDGGLPFSLQIGCPARIAERTGITVVSDFRRRDIAAGGEGAPLMPWIHRRLFARGDADVAVLNIGGIANITWLGRDGQVTGFDTGPGNMLMDGLMLELSDGRYAYDDGGALAEAGKECASLLQELLAHSYFSTWPPKSTGRETFGRKMLDRLLAWPELDDASRMRAAAMLTVRSIVDAQRFLPSRPSHWWVCGGGARNRFVMRQLRAYLHPARVSSTDELGYPADAIEAMGFALLAEATLRGCSNTCPEVTGARSAICGGQITPGRNWPGLLASLAREMDAVSLSSGTDKPGVSG